VRLTARHPRRTHARRDRQPHLHPARRPERAERAYVGFVGDEGEEGVRRAHPPATLDRLARVKRHYDPDNVFHLNLNVVPEAVR